MKQSTSSSAPQKKNPWLTKIDAAIRSKGMDAWNKACDKIREKYRYEDSQSARVRRYQLLWSNIETLRGATYSKPPKAAVIRRWRDKDPTALVATQMLERCIDFSLDANEYNTVFENVRDDYLLYARGQARVYYEPVMEAVINDDASDALDETAVEGPEAEIASEQKEEPGEGKQEPEPSEVLKFENVKIRYVQRQDFVHSISRTWEEVEWVAFRSFLSREELIERFGKDLGKKINLDAANDKPDIKAKDTSSDSDPKATIWEIWDKESETVSWVAVGWPDTLEESEPYLKLENFFPCPKPAYGTLTNEGLDPRPDYIFYQDQCEEIDALTARIASLQESLKLVMFYPAGPKGEGSPEIELAIRPGVENKAIAVKSWAAFKEGSPTGTPVSYLPIDQVVKVLEGCVKMRQQLIEDVNQILGVADIMRGESNPNDTATAQGIKASYGAIRIRQRQAELSRFCRDITRLCGEIICNHFQPETIMAMSNMPLPTDAQVLQQLQEQQAQMQQQQMQAAMMGHNGGPPMQSQPGQAPQGQPPQQALQAPPGASVDDLQKAEIHQRMIHAEQQHRAVMAKHQRDAMPKKVLRQHGDHGPIIGIM